MRLATILRKLSGCSTLLQTSLYAKYLTRITTANSRKSTIWCWPDRMAFWHTSARNTGFEAIALIRNCTPQGTNKIEVNQMWRPWGINKASGRLFFCKCPIVWNRQRMCGVLKNRILSRSFWLQGKEFYSHDAFVTTV